METELKLIETAENFTYLAIIGRMDIGGAGIVESKFLGYTVARKQHAFVDISEVPFLGSMGIRVFVSAAKGLLRDKKKLILMAPQPAIEKTLKLSGFGTIILVVPSLAEAKLLIAA